MRFISKNVYRDFSTMRYFCQHKSVVNFCLTVSRKYVNTKVPQKPVFDPVDRSKLPPPTKIDQKTIELLERLSLVDFANRRGIEQLEEAITFADQIFVVDTSNVEPMISVLEDRSLYLREDKVTDGNCREAVMANAAATEEEYFVSPQGNIPLMPRKSLLEDEA